MKRHVCVLVPFLVLFVVLRFSPHSSEVSDGVEPLHGRRPHANALAQPTTNSKAHQASKAAVKRTHAAAPTWIPQRCMRGTELTHPKLGKACREGPGSGTPIDRRYCAAILNKSTSAPPVCGQYATGTWETNVSLITGATLEEEVKRHLDAERCPAGLFRRPVTASGDGLRFAEAAAAHHHEDYSHEDLILSACNNAFRYFGRIELASILHHASIARNGRGILFTGDSMIRQLMLRVVSYIRGEAYFSEHYFHQDGLYLLYEDSDELLVLDGAGKSRASRELQALFPGYLPAAEVASLGSSYGSDKRVLLAMMFQWETKPSVHRKEFTRMLHSPLHVAAFMYWWQNKDAITDIEPYEKAVEAYAAQEASHWQKLLAHRDYIFVSTPWTDPGLFGGVEPAMRTARNKKIWEWISGLQKRSMSPDSATRWSFLDYSGLADAHHLPKTKDGIHYMCIWTPKFPDTITMQKYNYNDCRDPMGLAVVQWLAHTISSGF